MMRIAAFGQMIRQARRARRLTQRELALRTGLSRLTLNQLENGVIPDLGVRKVGAVLDALGLELQVQPAEPRAGTKDFLSMAASSASVSLKEPLHPDELEYALLSGKIPANRRAHLITLLEEAPGWLLEGLVRQIGSLSKAGRVQRNIRKLAEQLGVSPEVGQWQRFV
ncbi:transcriptional regulator [Steroidobacter sp. S1-65]|uniref:Transcriptional regulator n=1 Tax=Steroidobacter gossypii TaxID=2805490 RepID=A0ABS1WX53_9GAMM|nr:helix-turn-helix transcriptional regulator [Steroidobacter gossypii]MBM0105556.1 transcriptional regulator [Steroidobacter gossypii]